MSLKVIYSLKLKRDVTQQLSKKSQCVTSIQDTMRACGEGSISVLNNDRETRRTTPFEKKMADYKTVKQTWGDNLRSEPTENLVLYCNNMQTKEYKGP